MNPMLTSMAGVLVVMVGLAAMLIMLELRGNPKERSSMRLLIRVHKVFGYLFILFFLFILVGMISKTKEIPTEFSPRVIIHATFALFLIPLLGIKVLMVRRYKRLAHWIMGLGIFIFILAFLLNSVTAGYVFLHPTVSPKANVVPEINNPDSLKGESLVQKKCTLCHTLDRVEKAVKNKEMWSFTIDRMISYSMKKDYISPNEKSLIITFLLDEKE